MVLVVVLCWRGVGGGVPVSFDLLFHAKRGRSGAPD
jgi:hypothetical protein